MGRRSGRKIAETGLRNSASLGGGSLGAPFGRAVLGDGPHVTEPAREFVPPGLGAGRRDAELLAEGGEARFGEGLRGRRQRESQQGLSSREYVWVEIRRKEMIVGRKRVESQSFAGGQKQRSSRAAG